MPAPDLLPWYVDQRLSLLGLVVLLVFALGTELVVRGDALTRRVLLQRLRLYVLGALFGAVAIWAFTVQHRREARRTWGRPLHVAVVLLAQGPLERPVVEAFQKGAARASTFIKQERARYEPKAGPSMYFHVFGPSRPAQALPAPAGTSVLDRLTFRIALLRYLHAVDAALDLPSDRFDERMYVLAKPPTTERAPRFVEGIGEAGGEFGVISVDLDLGMVEQAWIAVIHEVLHTLGANDKFDDEGHALVPEGLVEPRKVPPYPQRFAEIMVGELPLAPATGRLATGLSEVAVGALTAREIGWGAAR